MLQKAIDLKPGPALAATVYHNLGGVLHIQQKLPEAIAAYRRAIELKPDFAGAYSILGTTLAHSLNPEALVAGRKAIELNPKNAAGFDDLGYTLYVQQKLPEAEAVYREAIALRHDNADAYHNLGNVLFLQQRLPEAVAASQKAIALRPDFANAYNSLAHFLRQQKGPRPTPPRARPSNSIVCRQTAIWGFCLWERGNSPKPWRPLGGATRLTPKGLIGPITPPTLFIGRSNGFCSMPNCRRYSGAKLGPVAYRNSRLGEVVPAALPAALRCLRSPLQRSVRH